MHYLIACPSDVLTGGDKRKGTSRILSLGTKASSSEPFLDNPEYGGHYLGPCVKGMSVRDIHPR